MTHVINRNETSKAMVVFDVTVQVNSKPWSEVFLEGVERKDLGQTPLSGIRVPIGGVLIFEFQFEGLSCLNCPPEFSPYFDARAKTVKSFFTGSKVIGV